jgi:hypothetical protein
VVSMRDLCGRILGFLDRKALFTTTENLSETILKGKPRETYLLILATEEINKR